MVSRRAHIDGVNDMRAPEVKALRKSMGLSQEGLARILGLSSMTISRWEREVCRIGHPEAELLRRLAAESKVGAKSSSKKSRKSAA